MTHEEKALSYFQDKFHCSQSVLAAVLGGTIAATDAPTNLPRLNNDCMTFIELLD